MTRHRGDVNVPVRSFVGLELCVQEWRQVSPEERKWLLRVNEICGPWEMIHILKFGVPKLGGSRPLGRGQMGATCLGGPKSPMNFAIAVCPSE